MIVIDLDRLNFAAATRDLLEDLTDFQPLLKRLANECEDIWAEKFRAQGPGWAPLSEATLEKRRKDGKDAEILKDDGIMFNALTSAVGGAEAGSVYELSDTQLVIGTNLEYASAHQDSQRDWLPKRPFLPEPGEVEEDFTRVIERWAAEVGRDPRS